ncbi:MAG: hypothetical protein A2X03_16330 [Bacteroidetes bacterium GWA2_40_15]|nr:MAG: hypothetical protein A2X03_16330 [Bacteroidetes bacterium GWA2_40_15]
MYAHMAINAAIPVWRTYPVIAVLIDMPAILVATYTQGSALCNEQIFIICTMRIMTSHTVFPRWCMLPKERSAFFLMATVASLVHVTFHQHSASGSAVWIMAGRAINFTFLHRMARISAHFCCNIFMATGTKL